LAQIPVRLEVSYFELIEKFRNPNSEEKILIGQGIFSRSKFREIFYRDSTKARDWLFKALGDQRSVTLQLQLSIGTSNGTTCLRFKRYHFMWMNRPAVNWSRLILYFSALDPVGALVLFEPLDPVGAWPVGALVLFEFSGCQRRLTAPRDAPKVRAIARRLMLFSRNCLIANDWFMLN
jgi:hypothetical protein